MTLVRRLIQNYNILNFSICNKTNLGLTFIWAKFVLLLCNKIVFVRNFVNLITFLHNCVLI